MKKGLKIFLIALVILLGFVLIDLAIVLIGKTTPIIRYHEKDSNVYNAIGYRVYDCDGEKNVKFYWDKFSCPIKENKTDDISLEQKKKDAKTELLELNYFKQVAYDGLIETSDNIVKSGSQTIFDKNNIARFEVTKVSLFKEVSNQLLVNFEANYACKTGNECIYYSQRGSDKIEKFTGYAFFKYDSEQEKYVLDLNAGGITTNVTSFVGY